MVKPRVLVCLGATAAQALLGQQFRVTQDRGKWIESPLAPYVMATVHPSSILRAPDSETRHAEMAHFVADLRPVARRCRQGHGKPGERHLDLMNPEAIARLRHSLRTPLNHIIGYAEMVRDEASEQRAEGRGSA